MLEKILIVEDEARIVRTLRLYLEEAGFAVAAVYDGWQVMPAYRQERPALVLLDLNLPGQNGLDVCRALRRAGDVPIIMITARSEEGDRLVGLELGADDYIIKPFSPREVVARVRAVLRRVRNGGGSLLRAGELLVDQNGHRAWVGDHALSLTPSEFHILSLLVEHCGQVLSRAQLLQLTHGVSDEELARTVDQHVKNLRRKLRAKVGAIPIIHTVYGVGYRLDEVHLSHG